MSFLSLFSLLFISLADASQGPSCSAIFAESGAHGALIAKADPPGRIVRRLKQLTGVRGRPRDHDFGDPSPPDFSEPGVVRVYTTSGHVLVWKETRSESATVRFLRGVPPQYEFMRLVDTDGRTEMGGWDPTIEVFPEFGGRSYLYAGVMTPPPGRRDARWPEDNWRRRVNAFEWKKGRGTSGRWQRMEDSVLGDAPAGFTWMDHSYGHHVIRDERGRPWMFYEKVTEERDGNPWRTEIFARRMIDPLTLAEKEHSIFGFSKGEWPAMKRSFGGYLVEGARPVRMGDWYVIGFSAGEYASPRYGIHLMASRNITGPYQPYLNSRGTDLKDFGRAVERVQPQTWGAARPAFFEVEGNWWVLFHGIQKSDAHQVEQGQRDVYLAPVDVKHHKDAPPTIQIRAR